MPDARRESIEALPGAHAVRGQRRRWLVTGSAGFIGSHLLEALLRLDHGNVTRSSRATLSISTPAAAFVTRST